MISIVYAIIVFPSVTIDVKLKKLNAASHKKGSQAALASEISETIINNISD